MHAVAGTAARRPDARILGRLGDGRARTAVELARAVHVPPAAVGACLARLLARGQACVASEGRHRYYARQPTVRRAGEGAAAAVRVASTTPVRLRAARTCYDHLAGALGVALYDRMRERGWLVDASDGPADARALSPGGVRALTALGVDVGRVHRSRRRFAYACLDWSERRPHLAGALGAALLDALLARGWVTRAPGSREIRVTKAGARELPARLGVQT